MLPHQFHMIETDRRIELMVFLVHYGPPPLGFVADDWIVAEAKSQSIIGFLRLVSFNAAVESHNPIFKWKPPNVSSFHDVMRLTGNRVRLWWTTEKMRRNIWMRVLMNPQLPSSRCWLLHRCRCVVIRWKSPPVICNHLPSFHPATRARNLLIAFDR